MLTRGVGGGASTPQPSPQPSFVIEAARRPGEAGRRRQGTLPLPWDRLDSRDLILRARQAYHQHLCDGACGEPLGVVLPLPRGCGRVVFEPPLLLPGEQFIPLEWIHGGRSRNPATPRRRTGEAGS